MRLRSVFIFVLAGVCLASLAAHAPLIDPDEGLHAAIAQEMLQRHEYVTPTFLGEPFLDKPILFFWAEAASLRVFGMNETAVRLPPLLFGLLGAGAIALLASAMFGSRAGLTSGVVYATMLLPVGVSEVAVHDIALVPFLAVACYGVWRAADAPRPLPWAVLIGASVGLSILTKGLVGVVFVGIFGLCIVAIRPAVFGRLAAVGIAAALIAVAVGAPWYAAMEHAHPGYLHYYFVERHLEGYLTSTQRHAGRGWWYYVPIVIGGALPWVPFAVTAASDSRLITRRAIWAWFGIGLVFLSIGESKLATYVLPVFPAIAIIIGDHLSRAVGAPGTRGFRTAFIVFAGACVVLPIAAVTGVAARFGSPAPFRQAAAVIAGLGVAIVMRRAWTTKDEPALAWMGTGAWLAFAAVVVLALPPAARWMSGRDLARILNARPALPTRVLVLDERIGSVIFYLSPSLRREATADRFLDTTLASAFERVRTEPGDTLLAVRDDQLPRLQRLFPGGIAADGRAGVYSVFSAATLRATPRVP